MSFLQLIEKLQASGCDMLKSQQHIDDLKTKAMSLSLDQRNDMWDWWDMVSLISKILASVAFLIVVIGSFLYEFSSWTSLQTWTNILSGVTVILIWINHFYCRKVQRDLLEEYHRRLDAIKGSDNITSKLLP